MSSNPNYKYKNLLRKHIRSYRYAFKGLILIFFNQLNFRLELIAAALVIILSFVFQIERIEFIIILFVVMLVLMAEALNSAVEAICDAVTKEIHHEIKYAKDISAGVVLLSAFLAILVGIAIFLPYGIEFLEKL